MPNTLTTIFRTVPSTEPAEAPHPNSGMYVTGTQLADGTWQVVHTQITKTSSPLTMTGRLKNFPTITASIVASGNILNIQQPAPTGVSAIGNGPTGISVTGNSGANATAYRFYSSAAQAGPFTVLVTQASATYNHTGLTNGTTVWYQMQYVGGGFYDDSPVSAAFSGTTAAVTPATVNTPQTTDFALTAPNADRSGRPFPSSLAEYTLNTDATTLTLNLTTNTPYSGSVSVFVNNVWNQTVTTTAGNGVSSNTATTRTETFALTLPAGVKDVTFDVSAVGRDDSGGFDYFWQSVQVVVPAGAALASRPWVKKTGEFIATLSDSIGVEATCTPGQGWLNQLRRKAGRATTDMIALGYGGASPQVLIGTAAARTAVVQQYAALSAGYTKKRFVVALGTNLNAGFDGPALQAALVALGNALVAGVPGFAITNFFIQIVPPNAAPNTTDYSPYRSAQASAAAALGARTVDAFAGQTPNSSGIHFDTATTATVNTLVASRYDAALVDGVAGYAYVNPEAQAWATAAVAGGGTLFAGMNAAVDALVTSLKNANLYAKTVAFYPFGTANLAGSALNLINPADADAAFRLVFTGSPVIGSRGLSAPTGNTYANTGLVPSVALPAAGFAAGAYLSELGTLGGTDALFGTTSASGANLTLLPSASGVLYWLAQQGSATPVAARQRAFYLGRKNGAAIRIGISVNGGTGTSANWENSNNADPAMPVLPLYLLGANNNGVAGNFTTATLGCAIFMQGLTLADETLLNSAIFSFISATNRA